MDITNPIHSLGVGEAAVLLLYLFVFAVFMGNAIIVKERKYPSILEVSLHFVFQVAIGWFLGVPWVETQKQGTVVYIFAYGYLMVATIFLQYMLRRRIIEHFRVKQASNSIIDKKGNNK